jgi:hypothetical protein
MSEKGNHSKRESEKEAPPNNGSHSLAEREGNLHPLQIPFGESVHKDSPKRLKKCSPESAMTRCCSPKDFSARKG